MSLAKNASYNLTGTIFSVIISLITIPAYLGIVGEQRYGILVIAWLLMGYFGLFDIGLGRTTSFNLAKNRGKDAEAVPQIFWTALTTNAVMGAVGGVVLWIVGTLFFGNVIKASPELKAEVLLAIPFLAASVPVATVSGVLTGALQGYARFLQTSIISVLSTALFQGLPLLVALTFSVELQWLLLAALVAKFVVAFALFVLCIREIVPGMRWTFSRKHLRSLLSYSFWVAVTSFLGPILFIVDRFLIGSILGAAAVAIYTVPFQITNRLAVLPQALATALFPRLSAASDPQQGAISNLATRTLVCLVTPPVVGALFILQPFLEIWVGSRIGSLGAPIGRILLIAIWFNAFSLVAFTRIQAAGRPELITRIFLLEVPFYLGALAIGLTYFGLIGCAVVAACRNAVDWMLLSYFSRTSPPLRLIGLNLVAVLAGLAGASAFGPEDWQWWVGGTLLSGTTGLIALVSLPEEVRGKLTTIWRPR